MLTISIDGACRRNGKPSCVSSGGVFIMHPSGEMETHAVYEHGSTNQRGELFALLTALEYLANANVEACIITDSEYIFNAMTKQWYVNWPYNNWLTAAGEPVKNSDIWKKIGSVELNEPVHFYHIKGHCIPFGKVTATKMLDADHTGASLRKLVEDKFDACRTTKADVFSLTPAELQRLTFLRQRSSCQLRIMALSYPLTRLGCL